MPIGNLTDFPDGKAVKASLDDETDLLVLRRSEEVLVVSNRCTHQGTPLHRGRLHASGNLVTIRLPLARQSVLALRRPGIAWSGNEQTALVRSADNR